MSPLGILRGAILAGLAGVAWHVVSERDGAPESWLVVACCIWSANVVIEGT